MGWVGLGPRIFDLPNVGLGTYFRQPNLPNNPLGQGNPSGQPYRTGTLVRRFLYKYISFLISYNVSGSLGTGGPCAAQVWPRRGPGADRRGPGADRC